MNKYELTVFWSVEDAVFVVHVPELPGCMAHGSDPVEAVESAQVAIDLWLDAAGAAGMPIPPAVGRLNVDFPELAVRSPATRA